MSAYSVPDSQLHVMVSYIVKNIPYNGDTFYIPPFPSITVGTIFDPYPLNVQAIWDYLRLANDTSVNARYNDTGFTDPVDFICVKDLPDPVAMIKLVHNFEYQACEYEDWYTSKAKAICDGIVQLAIDKLPGYEDGPWGFNGSIEPDPYYYAKKLASVDKPEPGKVYRLT